MISSVIHDKLLKLLRNYFFMGGMPEPVKTYYETSDLLEVERIHESILTSMELDFTKYTKNNQPEYLRRVFMSEKKKDFTIRFNTDLPGLADIKVSAKIGDSVKPLEYQLLSLPLYMVNFIDELLGENSAENG